MVYLSDATMLLCILLNCLILYRASTGANRDDDAFFYSSFLCHSAMQLLSYPRVALMGGMSIDVRSRIPP